jgi:uncharacterized membrane protein YdbT with pleckstrin-like domain
MEARGGTMRCPQCGFDTQQGSAFCSRCGARLSAPRPSAVREYALDTFRPSLWYFANSFVGAGVVLVFGAIVLYQNHDLWQVGFALMAAGVVMFIVAIIRSRSVSWRLTSDRLIEQRGILARRRREMELADIRSVELTQRVMQRAMRLGDVTIASAASADFAIRMHDVANPGAAAETVRQARLKRLA